MSFGDGMGFAAHLADEYFRVKAKEKYRTKDKNARTPLLSVKLHVVRSKMGVQLGILDM
jgi:hypothetical protein